MARCMWLYLLLCGFFFLGSTVQAATIAHELDIVLEPEKGLITVRDTLRLPPEARATPFQFMLNDNLKLENAKVRKIETGVALSNLGSKANVYEIDPTSEIILQYSGRIQHALGSTSKEYAQSFQETAGMISEQGVFLDNTSAWYPMNTNHLVSFSMTVTLPQGWQSVSQGLREQSNNRQKWTEKHPQNDIYLIAARFQEYEQKKDDVTAMVFLREADSELAEMYLDATFQYIDMYEQLLGEYPYGKFAMVENFWETGYGMPSFTLLGPRVLRFPFILYTSYPHEILHNWWGNGVYVDYEQGNWAEGLTAYLSDHLFKDLRGQGHHYRRDVLQKYTDYVNEGKDFALAQFQARHSSASEAVGYGKSLMLFHMLRSRFGDEKFKESLNKFYQRHRFKQASFSDIQSVFEEVTGEELEEFFQQWVQKPGAPQLELVQYGSKKKASKYHMTIELAQTQQNLLYELQVPIAIGFENGSVTWKTVPHTKSRQSYEFEFTEKPVVVSVDPYFDLFRRLDNREIPAALSQGFGAEKVTIVLPAEADKTLYEAYELLAKRWQASQPGTWQVIRDDQSLPEQGAIWLLGWENKYRKLFERSVGSAASLNKKGVKLDQQFPAEGHSFVISARHKDKPQQTLLWLATDSPAAIPGLARKLPHYRKYSYLAFTGDSPDNIAKGQWESLDSPLTARLDKVVMPPAITRQQVPLTQLPALFSRGRH